MRRCVCGGVEGVDGLGRLVSVRACLLLLGLVLRLVVLGRWTCTLLHWLVVLLKKEPVTVVT
jgi:hypothetical protein